MKRVVIVAGFILTLAQGLFAAAPPKVAVFEAQAAWTDLKGNPPDFGPVESGAQDRPIKNDVLARNGFISLALAKAGLGIFSVDKDGRETLRARITIVDTNGKTAGKLAGGKIVSFNNGGVEFDVTIAGDDVRFDVRFHLKRGEPIVKIVSGKDTTLKLETRSEYAVLPAFVGDDILINPAELKPGNAFLPADNILLHFLDGGNAMIQIVWPTGTEQAAGAEIVHQPQPCVRDTCVTLSGQPVYVAAWELADLWHARKIDATFGERPKTRDVPLGWKFPFRADWRAIYHAATKDTTWKISWRRGTREWGPHGRAQKYIWPFWAVGAGGIIPEKAEAVTHMPPAFIMEPVPNLLLVYALERNKLTPRETFTPEDILRMALGTGPCAYVLGLDGQDAERANRVPLCGLAAVFGNVALIYHDAPRTPEIAKIWADYCLEQGVWQYERLKQYAKFAESTIAEIEAIERTHPKAASALDKIKKDAREILGHMTDAEEKYKERHAGFRGGAIPKYTDAIAVMHFLAEDLKRAISERNVESHAEWRMLWSRLHGMSVVPQGILPHPRRLTRQIQYEISQVAKEHPEIAAPATRIRSLAGRTLRSQHWAEQGVE